jgi:hypothetical protein
MLLTTLSAALIAPFVLEIPIGSPASPSMPHIGFEDYGARKCRISRAFFARLAPTACLPPGSCLVFQHVGAGFSSIILRSAGQPVDRFLPKASGNQGAGTASRSDVRSRRGFPGAGA